MINTEKNVEKFFHEFVNKSSSLKSLTKTQETEVLNCILSLSKIIDKRWISINEPPEKAKLVLVRRTSGEIIMARLTDNGWYCYWLYETEENGHNEIYLKADPIVEWQDLPQDKNEPEEE